MISISLCMIVRNEEKYLATCLESVKDIVDEIIIVDTGSKDYTKEIASRYTHKIYDYEWQDDFSKARNFSFSKATKEYILWLDADDVILRIDQNKLMQLKQRLNPEIDVVYMQYKLGEYTEDYPTCVFWRERLVKREKHFKWMDPVHEYIECTGNVARMDIAITHTKYANSSKRNLMIYKKYIEKGKVLNKRQCFHYARELYALDKIDEAIKYYELFLESKGELRSNYLYACMGLANCYEKKKDDKNCLKSLLRYFEIEEPRAEICCKLANYYMERNELDKAIAWYTLAPITRRPTDSMGAIMPEYWEYVPYMELCACYYKLGNLDKAIYYNEKVAELRPDDEKMLKNRCVLAIARANLKENVMNPK